VFENFYAANNWTKDFLPNNYMRISSAKGIAGTWFSQFIEMMLNNKAGNKIDDFFMKLTDKSWKVKTKKKKRNSRGVVMALHASKHFSKPDPANFQFKLLQLYENNLSELLNHYEHSSRLTNEIL
jgi:hypothetical protein